MQKTTISFHNPISACGELMALQTQKHCIEKEGYKLLVHTHFFECPVSKEVQVPEVLKDWNEMVVAFQLRLAKKEKKDNEGWRDAPQVSEEFAIHFHQSKPPICNMKEEKKESFLSFIKKDPYLWLYAIVFVFVVFCSGLILSLISNNSKKNDVIAKEKAVRLLIEQRADSIAREYQLLEAENQKLLREQIRMQKEVQEIQKTYEVYRKTYRLPPLELLR